LAAVAEKANAVNFVLKQVRAYNYETISASLFVTKMGKTY